MSGTAVSEVEVKGFRGIFEARLAGLTGINIFVGRNNSGKSSILEALYISLNLDEGLKFVLRRRGWFGSDTALLIFHMGHGRARIEVGLADGQREVVDVEPSTPDANVIRTLEGMGIDIRSLQCVKLSASGKVNMTVELYVDADGRAMSIVRGQSPQRVGATFIDWNSVLEYGRPEDAYALMVRGGGREAKVAVVGALRRLYPEVKDIEPLKVGDRWVLHVVSGEAALPYYALGDGVRHALTYLMYLSSSRGNVLLLEEPELHMHPGLMGLVASAIVGTYAKRGNQVFLSTHSIELVDALIAEARRVELHDADLKVHRLVMRGGKLHSEEYSLNEAEEARTKLEWDLRS